MIPRLKAELRVKWETHLRRGLLSLRNHIPTRVQRERLSVRNEHLRVVTPN